MLACTNILPIFFPNPHTASTGAFTSSVAAPTQGDLAANKAGGVKTILAESKNVASGVAAPFFYIKSGYCRATVNALQAAREFSSRISSSLKTIQASLEDISYLLRIPQRKPYGTMESNVKKALKVAVDDKDAILASIPADSKDKGSELYTTLIDGKGGLQSLIKSIKNQDPDKVSLGLAASLDTVAELELLQASGLSFLLPGQYLSYPRLAGRGTVEITIEKGDGSSFTPEAGGDQRKSATIQVVIDGYYLSKSLEVIDSSQLPDFLGVVQH